MDAFRTLTRGVLPPAGHPVVGPTGAGYDFEALFPQQRLHWVDSGTSALALALSDVKQRFPEVKAPEVVIPAYCCPDLVAAALYAGLTPVLADLAPDSCQFRTGEVERCVSERTLAIIAVNFLGIEPPLSALSDLCHRHRLALIEDSAQWFPEREAAQPSPADYRVFSFGRGKPVTLLGGGLLVSHRDCSQLYGPAQQGSQWAYRAKCRVYNTLLRPSLYQLLARNPLVNLGETRYHPLETIRPMAPVMRQRLAANLRAYQARKPVAEPLLCDALEPVNRLAPLLRRSSARLLRYPLLVDHPEQRDRLLEAMGSAGLGATRLYGRALPEVAGVPAEALSAEGTTEADHFARRFMTLPVHAGVDESLANAIADRALSVLATD